MKAKIDACKVRGNVEDGHSIIHTLYYPTMGATDQSLMLTAIHDVPRLITILVLMMTTCKQSKLYYVTILNQQLYLKIVT